MSRSHRRVVAELSKAWEQAVAKGKLESAAKIKDLRTWMVTHPSLTTFQTNLTDRIEKFRGSTMPKKLESVTSGEIVPEKTKVQIGRLMAAYEELIGISEVKKAHERVLATEAKFIACQEQRRTASRELLEVQNQLTDVRQELDRAQRGDESYLDLIKKEIGAMKEERILRKQFDELERAERELFSALSNALRFSHEKERAQSEKTKYWSIMGSIVGATIGILGTTINNRMKQKQLKNLLSQTSAQVAAIQATVDNLTAKVGESSTSSAELKTSIDNWTRQNEVNQKLLMWMEDSNYKLRSIGEILKTPDYPKHDKSESLALTPMQFNEDKRGRIMLIACAGLSTIFFLYRVFFAG